MTTDHATPQQDPVERIGALIGGRRAVMLTTIGLDGELHARPMALPEREFDGTLWFLSQADAPKVAEIEANPRVNLSFIDGSYLSVTGRASVSEDQACKAELWDDIMEQWFGAGPDDPSVVALRVDIVEAEYWDTPGRPSEVITLG